jgi:hypothetical protein
MAWEEILMPSGGKLIHGHCRRGQRTKLYWVWAGMIQRCENSNHKSYARYQELGVTVCAEWHDFSVFVLWAESHGYKQGLQIDREKNTEGYNPSNCRFVTNEINSRNRRDNFVITAFGETKTAAEWVRDKRCEAKDRTLRYRIGIGVSPEEAMSIHKRKSGPATGWRQGRR